MLTIVAIDQDISSFFCALFTFKQRKQRDVRKANEFYVQLINQALPIEVQQEVEKERLMREKGI